jgi:hypothetical protein
MIDIVEGLQRRAGTRRAIRGELDPVAIDLEQAANEIIRLRRLLEDASDMIDQNSGLYRVICAALAKVQA